MRGHTSGGCTIERRLDGAQQGAKPSALPTAGAGVTVRRAIVTGAGGQDGSYLAELLRSRDYDVIGVEHGDVDLTNMGAVVALLRDAAPDEVYNLASPSFVPRSWEQPLET